MYEKGGKYFYARVVSREVLSLFINFILCIMFMQYDKFENEFFLSNVLVIMVYGIQP